MFDYEGSRHEFLKFLAEFGEEPAFLARARAVETALELLVSDCTAKYEEMLRWPKWQMSVLAAQLNHDWARLGPLLAGPESVTLFEKLHAILRVNKPSRANWFDSDAKALRRFMESAERFNRGWWAYLEGLDLEHVNQPRRDYNEFYSLEKACAFGSEKVAEDFEPLTLIDGQYLREKFPLLILPSLR